jgi:hypothetical protein
MDELRFKGFTAKGSKLYWEAIKMINDGRQDCIDLQHVQEALLHPDYEDILWIWKTVNLNERG